MTYQPANTTHTRTHTHTHTRTRTRTRTQASHELALFFFQVCVCVPACVCVCVCVCAVQCEEGMWTGNAEAVQHDADKTLQAFRCARTVESDDEAHTIQNVAGTDCVDNFFRFERGVVQCNKVKMRLGMQLHFQAVKQCKFATLQLEEDTVFFLVVFFSFSSSCLWGKMSVEVFWHTK